MTDYAQALSDAQGTMNREREAFKNAISEYVEKKYNDTGGYYSSQEITYALSAAQAAYYSFMFWEEVVFTIQASTP